MKTFVTDDWVTVKQAKELVGYTLTYLRRLAANGQVTAQRIGNIWLLQRTSLLAYKEQMADLGTNRHNPWRTDLATHGRGRKRKKTSGQSN